MNGRVALLVRSLVCFSLAACSSKSDHAGAGGAASGSTATSSSSASGATSSSVTSSSGNGGAGASSSSSSTSSSGSSVSSSSGAGGAANDGGLDGGAPGTLDLRIDYLTQDVAFVVRVTVGATTFDAVLDTGSSGLRILPGVVMPSDLVSTSTTMVDDTYASGTVVTGNVATANVTLGGLTTPTPINVEMITTVGCTTALPNCPANGETAATFAFKNQAGGTYRAIMGVGMRNHASAGNVANPIAQLAGQPAFVIDASGGYGSTSATLTIGPSKATVATFGTVQLPAFTAGMALPNGVPTWDDTQNNLCVADTTTAKTFCAPTIFDCGNASTQVSWAPHNGAAMTLATGDSVDVSVHATSTATSAVLGSYMFTVGATPTAGLDKVDIKPTSGASSINVGTALFFRSKVLLDQAHGLEGVAPF